MNHRSGQGGFTLIELMVSMALVLILATALGGILLETERNVEAVISQVALSREARSIYEMLALGGHRNTVNDTTHTVTTNTVTDMVDFEYVFGLRSRTAGSPTETGWRRPAIATSTNVADLDLTSGGARLYRFALSPSETAPDLTTYPGQVESQSPVLLGEGLSGGVTVPCTGTDLPLKGCATGASVTSYGFLEDDPVSDKNTYNASPDYGLAFRLIDPRRLGSPRAYLSDFSSTYWFVFRSVMPVNVTSILY